MFTKITSHISKPSSFFYKLGLGSKYRGNSVSASLRTADAFPVVTSLPPKTGGREATTGNRSAVRRLRFSTPSGKTATSQGMLKLNHFNSGDHRPQPSQSAPVCR